MKKLEERPGWSQIRAGARACSRGGSGTSTSASSVDRSGSSVARWWWWRRPVEEKEAQKSEKLGSFTRALVSPIRLCVSKISHGLAKAPWVESSVSRVRSRFIYTLNFVLFYPIIDNLLSWFLRDTGVDCWFERLICQDEGGPQVNHASVKARSGRQLRHLWFVKLQSFYFNKFK